MDCMEGYWDVNGLNRQLFHSADIHKSFNLLFAACSLMKGSNDQQAREIKELIARNFLHPDTNTSLPETSSSEIRTSPSTAPPLDGIRTHGIRQGDRDGAGK